MSSLFGKPQPQQSQSLFGATSQPQQGGGLFGGNAQSQGTGLFGQSTQQQPQQQSGGLFGGLGQNTQQQPQQQSGNLFGGLGQNTQQQPQQSGGLFSNPQPQSTGLFGQSAQQQNSGLFGGTRLGQSTTQQGGGLFGGGGLGSNQRQPQQQQGVGLFGASQSTQNLQNFGQTQPQQQQQQQQQQPTLQLGQSQQATHLGASQAFHPLWTEGRGLEVYRTVPAQIAFIAEKWNPLNLNSPLRTYLYQVVDEDAVPFYQPHLTYDPTHPEVPLEDETKWEEAVTKRPGPNYVPVLVAGFWALGKRAQRQREFIEKCNIRLHDINASLDAQLEIHNQRIATRIAECRRKHTITSQRTLALAAKIQILRNRGYIMDNAEEELASKLKALEREVFDPTLTGREQEIWARMLEIRERGKRLKVEMEKAGAVAKNEDAVLDEETVRIAKKALEAYDTQLRHLQKELELVQQEYDDWEKQTSGLTSNSGNGR